MLNGFGWPHVLIIAALLVILFGAKRLPSAARGIGESMRIFKAEMHKENSASPDSQQTPSQGSPQLSVQPQVSQQSPDEKPQL